jgi:hypothetical protein
MTELRRFRERQGSSRMALALAALVGATVATTVLMDGRAGQAIERLVSGHVHTGLALANGSQAPIYNAEHASALVAAEEGMLDRKAAMIDASDALQRMARASDTTSDAYPSGEAGLEARQRDFVAASNDYASATAKLDTRSEAAILADRSAGPGTSWRTDDFSFSLDALEAVGAKPTVGDPAGSLKR